MELGARLGGDNITTHLTPLSTGVDMVEACINIALGERPDLRKIYDRGAAIRYFQQHKGIIKEICGIKRAENIKGIVEVCIVHGIGEEITDIKDSASRMGFVIAEGESAKSAIETCEHAFKYLEVKIK